MSLGPSKFRGGNVVHRIELPRRRWPVRGRFALGWPGGVPPLPSPLVQPAAPAAELHEARAEPRRQAAREAAAREALEDVRDVLKRRRAPAAAPGPQPPAAPVPAGLDPQREAAFRREIELLERRLRKMNGLLEDREDQLRKLVTSGRVDSGLASLYREVQGIADDSPMAETKREMMSSIFEANRKLQRRLRELEHGDGPERHDDAGAA